MCIDLLSQQFDKSIFQLGVNMISLDASCFHEKCYFNVEAIRAQDPLNADLRLSSLPAMNAAKDTDGLVRLLQYLVQQTRESHIDTSEKAFAAMRDIGIVLGSLKRHGVEPVQAVPEVEQPLVDLGAATNMIPRDTVHHYTSWNPVGARRRSYTGEPQEIWLQDAVVRVFPSLSASLAISDVLSTMSPHDVRFAPTVGMLHESGRTMVDAIDSVTERVSPVFFAQVLRPYFEDVVVRGERYLGPAAAQAPLWLVDLCVWASDRNQADYKTFLVESVHYSLPSWRAFYQRHCHDVSLVTKVTEALDACTGEPDGNLVRSATSLTELMTLLKVFRGRHIGIARKAYAEEVALYAHGSGGAPVALLRKILDLTRENEHLMRERANGARRGQATQAPTVTHEGGRREEGVACGEAA